MNGENAAVRIRRAPQTLPPEQTTVVAEDLPPGTVVEEEELPPPPPPEPPLRPLLWPWLLLLLALVPAIWYRRDSLILPRRERWFVIACCAAFLLFCSVNQYSRLQWNSGFRYLLPLVPLLVLALADHWIRMPHWTRVAIAAAAVDEELEGFLHLWSLNRGVLLTPFHNMALMCPATRPEQVDRHTEVFDAALGGLFGT